jgi:hypothetical protein
MTSSNDKIIKILRRIDDILQRNGYHQYQERIHRISKTLLSVGRHNNCYVSRFSIEHKNEDHVGYEDVKAFTKENDEFVISSDEEDEVEGTAPKKQAGLDGILGYIENELKGGCDSTSSSDEDEGKCNGLQGKFQKMEHRLVNYLRNQQDDGLFSPNELGSVLSDAKHMRTPISKMPVYMNTTRIIKNFFEDKEVIEETKKRMSVFDIQKEQLEKLSAIQKFCKSNFDKISCRDTGEEGTATQRVSDFTDEIAAGLLMSTSKGSSFNFNKRGSIFAERRSTIEGQQQARYEEELLDANEIISDESDSE